MAIAKNGKPERGGVTTTVRNDELTTEERAENIASKIDGITGTELIDQLGKKFVNSGKYATASRARNLLAQQDPGTGDAARKGFLEDKGGYFPKLIGKSQAPDLVPDDPYKMIPDDASNEFVRHYAARYGHDKLKPADPDPKQFGVNEAFIDGFKEGAKEGVENVSEAGKDVFDTFTNPIVLIGVAGVLAFVILKV